MQPTRCPTYPRGRHLPRRGQGCGPTGDRAVEVARSLAEGATGQVRLSYVLTIPGGLPERIVREYPRRYPSVKISAESGSTAQNAERLRSGELDVAFAHTPF